MKNQPNTAQHGAYQLLDDVLNLVGSFARFGKAIATSKIQSTADSANRFVQSKMDGPDLKAHLSGVADNLEAISDYAIHTDVKHMVHDVGAFARKHPVTALVSVIAAGAMISRLVRTTPTVVKATRRTAPKSKAKKTSANVRRKANGSAQTHA